MIALLESAASCLEVSVKEAAAVESEEEEDIISRISLAVAEVPAEIRQWLSSTFSRTQSGTTQFAHKSFRAVAHVSLFSILP